MKIIKRILIGLLVIVAIAAIIPMFLASSVKSENSIVINAPAENAYELIANFKNWNRWSAWNKMDPDMKIVYGGPDAGAGSWYTWDSKNENLGNGKATIESEAHNDSIRVKLEFMGGGMPAYATYKFKKEGTGVKITCTFTANMGYFMRFFSGMFEKEVNSKTAEGFVFMKTICEEGPKKTTYEVYETWQNEQPYYSLRDTCTFASIGAKYMANFPALFEAVGKNGGQPAGAPLAIVHTPDTAQVFDIEWCMPTTKVLTASGNFNSGTFPAGKLLRVDYYGPYEKAGAAYTALFTYAVSKKMKPGKPREVYITDPMAENGKMERVLTIVLLPVE